MSFTAFLLIVCSAGLHASWNLVAKKNRMSIPFYTIICTTATLLWLHVQFWTPIKVWTLPGRFYLAVLASVGADVLYCSGLVMSYRRMEMATAYPVMRALPIILTALATSALGWGAPLTAGSYAGFLIVFAGALLMPLNQFSDFRWSRYWNGNMLFILLVACGTTGYTVLDGRATEVLKACLSDVSAPVRAMTFYSFRGLTLGVVLWLIVLTLPALRRELRELVGTGHLRAGMLAGLFASLSYSLVLCAMNYVTNVAFVQVFRQLGLPIGMALGVLILKEHCTRTKVLGVTLILTGLTVSVLPWEKIASWL